MESSHRPDWYPVEGGSVCPERMAWRRRMLEGEGVREVITAWGEVDG